MDEIQAAIVKNILERSGIGEEILKCLVCDCTMTGRTPALMHIQGKNHLKKMRASVYSRQNNSASDSSSSNVSNLLSSPDLLTDSTSELKNDLKGLIESGVIECTPSTVGVMFRCTVCNKTMSGSIPAQQHIDSEKHIKNQTRSGNLFSTPRWAGGDTELKDQSNVIPRTLFPMSKSPLSSNLSSPNKSSLARAQGEVDAAVDNGVFQKIGPHQYFCTLCGISKYGADAAFEHIYDDLHINNFVMGTTHHRSHESSSNLTAKTLLSQELNNGRSPNTAPADDGDASLNDSIVKVTLCNNKLQYECMLCKAVLDSEDNLKLHLQSDAHLSKTGKNVTMMDVQVTDTIQSSDTDDLPAVAMDIESQTKHTNGHIEAESGAHSRDAVSGPLPTYDVNSFTSPGETMLAKKFLTDVSHYIDIPANSVIPTVADLLAIVNTE